MYWVTKISVSWLEHLAGRLHVTFKDVSSLIPVEGTTERPVSGNGMVQEESCLPCIIPLLMKLKSTIEGNVIFNWQRAWGSECRHCDIQLIMRDSTVQRNVYILYRGPYVTLGLRPFSFHHLSIHLLTPHSNRHIKKAISTGSLVYLNALWCSRQRHKQ